MYVQAHVCSFHDGAAEFPSLMLLLLPETGSTPASSPNIPLYGFQ